MKYGGDMEQWSVRDDDRLDQARARNPYAWPMAALGIALIVGCSGFYYYYFLRAQPAPSVPAAVAPPLAEPAPAPQADAQPAIRHPLVMPQAEVPQALPSLDDSDPLMRDSLTGLIGGRAFAQIVIPEQLVRRIVATADNLPRPTAPRRLLPLNSVPGAFVTAGSDDGSSIDPANSARYAPYVRVMESLNARSLVNSYVRAYPLFQRAYEELGYPGKYFNDRLVEAIDDMLAAPEMDAPVRLVQPKVVYEFADPELESRSAGQKIMLRIGKDNALRVKAKLREIRRELTAVSGRRP
jgi:hypothetical protein